jgi:hypothetical protein
MLWRPKDFDLLSQRLDYTDDVVLWPRAFNPILFKADYVHLLDVGPKPRGIWYACGDEWIRLLLVRGVVRPRHAYRLDIDKSTILIIHTLGELRQFTRTFGVESFDNAYDPELFVEPEYIDWRKVAKLYDGIEICSYQDDAKWSWYLGWDAASGCIWRPRIIRSVRGI